MGSWGVEDVLGKVMAARLLGIVWGRIRRERHRAFTVSFSEGTDHERMWCLSAGPDVTGLLSHQRYQSITKQTSFHVKFSFEREDELAV